MTKPKKAAKRRKGQSASKAMLERISNLVADAYEVGHDHGGNAMRIALKQPPRSIDKGWSPIAKKLQQMFKRHAF